MALLGKWFGFGREELYDQAMQAYDHGDWEGAIERFETCLDGASDPSMVRLASFYLAESYAQLGLSFMRVGDFIDAARNLNAAVQISPNYPDLYVALARAYRELHDQESRARAIDRALAINPKYVDAIYEQGVLWYELGRHADGLERVHQAVLTDSTLNGRAFVEAAEADKAGNSDAAAATLRLVGGGPLSGDSITLRLAESYARDRLFEEAAEEYRKVLANGPRYPDVHCRFGQVLLELGDNAGAVVQFKEAIALNPKYAEAHAFLGVALRRMKENDLAHSEFQRSLELDPLNQVALSEVQRLRTA